MKVVLDSFLVFEEFFVGRCSDIFYLTHTAETFFQVRRLLCFAGILLALAGTVTVSSVRAADGDALSGIEQRLYSQAYDTDPIDQRLMRLETSLFGETRSGSLAQRQTVILQTMKSVKTLQASQQRPSQSASDSNSTRNGPSSDGGLSPVSDENAPLSKDGTDYPSVSAMEKKVLGQAFPRQDLSYRLSRLETQVFGQPQAGMQLVDRVDALQAKLSGASQNYGAAQSSPAGGDGYRSLANPGGGGWSASTSSGVTASQDSFAKLDALEAFYFAGQNFRGELITERLDRLESKSYGRVLDNTSISERIDRLTKRFAVQSARANADNPQTYSTGGSNSSGFTSFGSSNSASSNGYSGSGYRTQSVQFGTGMGQSGSYQMSPEMQSMLTPEMRTQLQNSSGTAQMLGPTTITLEDQRLLPPQYGYNRNGAVINQGAILTQRQTTVFQPDGNVFSGGNQYSVQPGMGAGWANNPVFVQSLNQLEGNIYGRVDRRSPVPVRLGRLETALLGQVYPNVQPMQRLQTLEQAYRIQAVSRVLGRPAPTRSGGVFISPQSP